MTALHLAAGKGDARTVERIISENPKCYELVDNRGWNFLHYAMVSFHVGQLRNLLENNSLARSLIDEGDAKGNTPLHVLAAVRPKEFHVLKSQRIACQIEKAKLVGLPNSKKQSWSAKQFQKIKLGVEKLVHAIQDPAQRFDKLNPTWSRMHSINREAFCNCKYPNLREVESNCK